jgi:hypothetical protein
MGLLALALKTQNRKAKKIIRQIVANDKEISRWMSKV